MNNEENDLLPSVLEPDDIIKKAIIDKNYNIYGIPLFEHYNWCIEYLGRKDFVFPDKDGFAPIQEEIVNQIQSTMIKACRKYLGEEVK